MRPSISRTPGRSSKNQGLSYREPGEIEAVLAQHGNVSDAFVAVKADQEGEKQLVAYIVSLTEPAPTSGELRDYLKERLPHYMIPSAFLTLKELPLMPNGKIDRRALPELESSHSEIAKSYEPPVTEVEQVLCGMILGILKAGGAYLPLDPQYPQDRVRFMIEDAGMPVLLTQTRLLHCLPSYDGQVVCLDTDSESIARCSKENPRPTVTSQNLAYMIYTSGSTGRPKGVLVEHQGLRNLARAQAMAFGIGPDSCVLQFASMCFDASVSEVFVALLNGARLYLDRESLLLAGPNLARLLREQKITVVTLPPSVLSTLVVEQLPLLLTLVVAGEACPPTLVSRWAKGRRFLNAYGPTEITVCATVAECSETRSERPPIGHPMAGIEAYLLNPDFEPVLAGTIREIFLGGVGVARGYHNCAQLTAERFVPHGFSELPGKRLYRTGDLGNSLPDGQIHFVGRIDNHLPPDKATGF